MYSGPCVDCHWLYVRAVCVYGVWDLPKLLHLSWNAPQQCNHVSFHIDLNIVYYFVIYIWFYFVQYDVQYRPSCHAIENTRKYEFLKLLGNSVFLHYVPLKPYFRVRFVIVLMIAKPVTKNDIKLQNLIPLIRNLGTMNIWIDFHSDYTNKLSISLNNLIRYMNRAHTNHINPSIHQSIYITICTR